MRSGRKVPSRPSSKSRMSMVRFRMPNSEVRSNGEKVDCSDSSLVSGRGRSELEREVPLLHVSSILRHELESMRSQETDTTFIGHEILGNVATTKPSWTELYDQNNNLVALDKTPSSETRETVEEPEIIVSAENVQLEYIDSKLTLEEPKLIRLSGCPTYTVFQLGGEMAEFDHQRTPTYQDKICISKDLSSQTFQSSKSTRSQVSHLTSKFLEWNIAEVSQKVVKSESTTGIQIPKEMDMIDFELVLEDEDGSNGMPFQDTKEAISVPLAPSVVPKYLMDEEGSIRSPTPVAHDRWELRQAQDSRSRIPDRISSQQSQQPSLSGFPQMRLQADFRSNPDFVTDFMSSIIPENFEADFISQAYSMGSKLLNAGLQLATTLIGDESDLEPREDVLKYNGYVIRTSGRGILLQGLYINCNVHQAHPDLEGFEAEPTSRLRIVLSLNHSLNTIPLASEHGYNTSRDPVVIIQDGRWTFRYGGARLQGESQPESFIDIEVPIGVAPESIRYSGFADGVLIIEAP